MTLISKVFRDESIAIVSFVVAAGTFMYKYSIDSVGMNYYIKYLQKYDANKQPVPVRQVLQFRFNAVLDDLKISPWNKEYYKIFIAAKLFDPIWMGSVKLKQGIAVAVPEYFQIGTEEGLKDSNILINKKPVDWSSEDGQKLLQNLFLSEDAQKFILAMSLGMTNDYYFLLRAGLPAFMSIGAYATMYRAYLFFKLKTRPDWVTAVAYCTIAVIFVLLFLFVNEGIYMQYERAVEDKTYSLGHNYHLGAIEYYTKKTERNKALRNLERNGHRRYTTSGDVISIWKPQGVPDSLKLKFAYERMEKFTSLKEAMTPPPVNPNPHPVL